MNIGMHALIVGGVAALGVATATYLQFPVWTMFVAWASYFMLGGKVKKGLQFYGLFLIGVMLGVLSALAEGYLEPYVGNYKVVPVVFIVAGGLTFFERIKLLSLIPAYYLGMVTFFASGWSPEFATIHKIIVPTAFGLFFAWVTIALREKA